MGQSAPARATQVDDLRNDLQVDVDYLGIVVTLDASRRGFIATSSRRGRVDTNRDAPVRANPERAGDLEGDTTHVVVDGSSRLAAAHAAGLPTVKILVSHDRGADSEELPESAPDAAVHRHVSGCSPFTTARPHRPTGSTPRTAGSHDASPCSSSRGSAGRGPVRLVRSRSFTSIAQE